MGTVYLGLVSKEGYIFITNDTFGLSENESAIARVNRYCGALIVTAKGDYLIRMKKLLDKSLAGLKNKEKGLSLDLASKVRASFEMKFQAEPDFQQNPLPFLLLLVGYHPQVPSRLEHIFVRNRVEKILQKGERKEYQTKFDIHSPVPVNNLFYGHSDLSQYLFRQWQANSINLETAKLLSYFAVTETQKIDRSILPDIRMATLSTGNGFEWIKEAERERLSDMVKTVDSKFSKAISGYFTSSEGASDKDMSNRVGK